MKLLCKIGRSNSYKNMNNSVDKTIKLSHIYYLYSRLHYQERNNLCVQTNENITFTEMSGFTNGIKKKRIETNISTIENENGAVHECLER